MGVFLLYYISVYLLGGDFMKMRPEHKKKAIKLLSSVVPFSSLSPQKLEELVVSDGVELKEFSVGQQVFPCRSVSDSLAVLLSGECRTLADKTIVSVEHEGALFGAAQLYAKGGAQRRSEAATVCRVLFVSHYAVDMLIEQSSDFARSYIALLSSQVLSSEEKSQAASPDKAKKVLAGYLLSRPRNSKGEVALPQDMFKLAKQLELDKNTLFKAIEAFNAEGLIAFNGNAVCIADEEKLRSFI